MEYIFIHVLNISIVASFLVLAIIIYRLLARRAPRWVSVLLWGLVGLRLLFPFELESKVSLIPSKSTVPPTITHDRYPALDTGFGSLDEIVNPVLSGSMEARPEYSANPMHTWVTLLGWIWLSVMLCMLLYMVGSFIYLRVRTRVRVERESGIYLCDYVKTPFILGTLRPKIFLPSDISDGEYPHVVAHERAHIKRLDHVWKPLGFLLLSVYWFNPLLWAAYILLCRDIETACDERVISGLSDNERADYSAALLSLGVKGRVISACPLAFGEVSVKSRVSAISKYKRPALIAVAVSLAVCIVFAACFLTYKKNDSVSIESGIWYAGKVIGATDTDATLDGVPLLVFTENGDVLVETKNPSEISYVRLGKMNTAYVSRREYESLLDGMTLRVGYGAEYFHDTVKAAFRITPSVASGIEHREVYLLRTEKELYMGYADDGRIGVLYELRFNEAMPTYLYTSTFVSTELTGASVQLDTQNKRGRIVFSESNYSPTGRYICENSRVIFETDDELSIRLVFRDVGNMLIYSERESDVKGLSGLFADGASFRLYHRIYTSVGDTEWFDINGDGSREIVFVNIGESGVMQYIVHSMGVTLANGTAPFTEYDDARLEERDGSLYLVCEYGEEDLGSYIYKVTFDGERLIFTEE